MENIMEIRHLHKSFGAVQAVRDLNFCVKRGELFAFLGVNGAGKSTTINILCGELRKDSGSVTICGADLDTDPDSIRRKLGVVFQNSVLDKDLSVRDNLRSRAALYGIHGKAFENRLSELAELLEFGDLLKRPLGKLSGGQRRRIDIARALLHEPEILILDEPTTGLDPQTRVNLWQVIAMLRREKGMTVFLTTHYMEEAADADKIVILDKGRICAEGTPFELKEKYARDKLRLYTDKQLSVKGAAKESWGYSAYLDSTIDALDIVNGVRSDITGFEVIGGTMDDVFLNATGKKLENTEA